MSNLPTPRTDAAVADYQPGGRFLNVVPADFARQLERELAEAKAERDALKAALAIGQENCDAEYDRLRDERDEMTKVAQGACKAEGEALKREDRWRALAEELAGALEDLLPLCNQAMKDAGCYRALDRAINLQPGNAALARFRDAANPASARTPKEEAP